MIARSILFISFLFVAITKSSFADLDGDAKKELINLLNNSSLVGNQNAMPKITVTIYYESLCLDCVHLFKNQIGPNLAKFQKYAIFDFVPFGNTETKLIEGRWFFKCQNGFNECLKNKWQVCSIQVLLYKVQVLAHYLVCYMNSTDEIRSGYQCIRQLGLNYEYYSKIKKCFMNREFSDSLMIHYEYRTQNVIPLLTRMPVIIFNGVYNETEQYDAKNNLANVICKHLDPKPVENIC